VPEPDVVVRRGGRAVRRFRLARGERPGQ
jgi:hypothetical protein